MVSGFVCLFVCLFSFVGFCFCFCYCEALGMKCKYSCGMLTSSFRNVFQRLLRTHVFHMSSWKC
uniref:Secreted protein n=1 Tax=Mus musculus TaxID=10090 RepID=Q3UKY8_MOUSE|nr:unnamed protein product [Mus musculus]